MRKILVLFSASAAFWGQVLAQTNTPAPAPKIVFAEMTHDFGKVEAGQVVKYAYVFTNTGSATLEVTEVKPGCGCTTAGDWDKKVEPGKTGSIPVQFNTTGYGGMVTKFISVKCNDPAQPSPGLQLKGTVWKPIDVAPAFAMFQLPPDGQKRETKVIKITNNLDDPITITAPTNRYPAFEIELKTVTPGKEFELSVTVIPPVAEGTVSAPYTFTTSSQRMQTLNVVAYAQVQPLLSVVPAQITLPAGPLTGPFEARLNIQNNSTNSLVLSEPSLTLPGVDVQIKETTPGRQFAVSANFPAGFKTEAGKPVELHIKSNFQKVSTITVPVFQTQTPPAPPQAAAPAKS